MLKSRVKNMERPQRGLFKSKKYVYMYVVVLHNTSKKWHFFLIFEPTVTYLVPMPLQVRVELHNKMRIHPNLGTTQNFIPSILLAAWSSSIMAILSTIHTMF